MGTGMKRLGLLALLLALASTADAALFPLFGPATGILKGSATSPQTTAAVATDVTSLFSGCSGPVPLLSYTGACVAASATPGGSDTQVQYNASSVFTGDSNLIWNYSAGTPSLEIDGGGNTSPSCFPSSCTQPGITIGNVAGGGIGLGSAADLLVPGAIYTNQQYTYNHARIFLPNGELFWIDLSEGTNNTEWCAQQDNYPGPYPPSSDGPNGGSLFFSTCGDNDGAGTHPFIGAIRSGVSLAAIAIGNITDGPSINIFVHGAMVSAGGASITPTGSCGTVTTVKGGVQTGSFNSGVSGTCTATLAFADTSGDQTGWWCSAFDETHPAVLTPTGDTNSSCTVSGATTSGDKIVWHAFGY